MLVRKIEDFIKQYVSLEVPEVTLPIALWIIATHCFRLFDSFAYIVITSKTKQSGKTRLSEVIGFIASNPMNFSSMTPSTLFRVINPNPKVYYPPHAPFIPPTVIFDEAEELANEAATMRSILNAGYRKGQRVPRTVGQDVIQFEVYCPKIFILIGSVYDTLHDRSIIIDMKRGEVPKRFIREDAISEGLVLRAEIQEFLKTKRDTGHTLLYEPTVFITEKYRNNRAQFLSDRDEEIWLPLFSICNVLAPERMRELQRIAVDLSAMKTAERKTYKNLNMFESQAQQHEYAQRAAIDLFAIIGEGKNISSADAVLKLRDLDLSPWRTYKGEGIDQHSLSDLLASIGIPSVNIRVGSGRKNSSVLKGYRKLDIEVIVKQLSSK